MAVPTMYVRLMEAYGNAPAAERAALVAGAGTLRLCTSGSAALPAELHGAFATATGQTILERYGMTEIGMALSNRYEGPRIPGSVGVPLPGVTVEVTDDDGRPVSDGDAGELRVRSPQLFIDYAGDPAATAASYDDSGRFRTGDTGVRSTDGTIRLLGRTSVDILKSGGYKLSALEIEDVLRGHPALAEVAVVGVADPVWGDRVTACVVCRPGHPPPTLEDVQAFAARSLAPYKLPRALRVLNELPRNVMGKVQKSLLK
jgi:malonyl-CoA/methylmalonyl-CoA synthetase